MPSDTIFTVRCEHLSRLNADESVAFFANLLWAECRRQGLPVTSVNISSRINVPDGGVDASISSPTAPNSPLAQSGLTTFQLKTGNYKPYQPSVIQRELFGKKPPFEKSSLGNAVRSCMDANGRFVLVATGVDLTDTERNRAIKNIQDAFGKCGYTSPNVDVLSQNQLIALLQPFPSLSLAVNGNAHGPYETHGSWENRDQMRYPFKPGEPQTELIESLAEMLRENDAAIHLHIRGEAGIGKTRLTLEALRHSDLHPLVIYCDSPSKIINSELLYTLLRDDNPFSVILVVDECDASTRTILWDKLRHAGPRVKLITIFSEFEDSSGNTRYVDAPPLDEDQIVEILREYVPAAESASRWAEFCSGSPRVAHVVGLNLRKNPDDLLKNPDTVRVWDRYVVGNDQADSPNVRQRITVLRRIALFKRFGFGNSVIKEAKAVANLVAQDDPSITWARFEEIVQELRARKILQGEYTLYITPKLLHIKLWVDWWDVHGSSFDFEKFSKQLTPELLDWFFEMARYAQQSHSAERVFKTLLNEDGPFQQSGLLKDERGARFFLSLTEAAPAVALQSLKNTVGIWSLEDLLSFTTGRREVVWALERIVVWRELFQDAARLLLKLAEAENEQHISNNATGVFTGLFSPGYGPVAPTEASPEERFPILKGALLSNSKKCREIALLACHKALKTGHFSRMAGAEHQGLRREPKLWRPETWGELFEAYRRVWSLIREQLEQLPADECENAVNVLLSNARGLTHYANLSSMVTETLSDLADKPFVSKQKIIEKVENILHYDGKNMPSEIREQWEQLQRNLVTDDFHSLMVRYVGMDLLEDKFDDEGERVDKADPIIVELVKQVLDQPELLKPELNWLVTGDAKNGYRFGYCLGLDDKSNLLLPELLNAQRVAGENSSVFFLGGYFRAIKERDESAWEQALDTVAKDVALREYVPELTWRSGLTDRAASRILFLANSGAIPAGAFRFFSYGGVIRQISEERFEEWIEFLLANGTRTALACAVELCHFYYLMEEPKLALSKDLVFRVLTAPAFFTEGEDVPGSTHDEYEWSEVASAYIEQYSDNSLKIAGLMLANFRKEGTVVGAYHSQTDKVLNEVLKRYPIEVWSLISGYLGPPIDSRAFHIYQWLRDGQLSLIPSEPIWKWVEEDVEKRAWYLATFVPPEFPGNPESISAREILVRYGSRKDVRDNLRANFSTESWWGPESLHAHSKLEQLKSWKEGERDTNVLRWLDDNITSTLIRIEEAKVREERES